MNNNYNNQNNGLNNNPQMGYNPNNLNQTSNNLGTSSNQSNGYVNAGQVSSSPITNQVNNNLNAQQNLNGSVVNNSQTSNINTSTSQMVNNNVVNPTVQPNNISNDKFCGKCGNKLSSTDVFCGVCGERVNNGQSQTNNRPLVDNFNNNVNTGNNIQSNLNQPTFNNQQQVYSTASQPNNPKKNNIVKILAIIGGVVAGFVLLIVAIFLIASAGSKKLVCKSSKANITIMYNEEEITGYTAKGMSYELDKHQEYAKEVGIDAYIKEFNSWFASNTSGSCTIDGKEIKDNNNEYEEDNESNNNSSSDTVTFQGFRLKKLDGYEYIARDDRLTVLGEDYMIVLTAVDTEFNTVVDSVDEIKQALKNKGLNISGGSVEYHAGTRFVVYDVEEDGENGVYFITYGTTYLSIEGVIYDRDFSANHSKLSEVVKILDGYDYVGGYSDYSSDFSGEIDLSNIEN